MVATLLVAALENLQAIVRDCSARLENPDGHGLGVPTSELTILTKAEKKSLNRKLQKKRKKLSDPNAPKRPNSAYINYQAVRRAVAKEANPDVPYTELQKIIGEMWKNESEEVKKVRRAVPFVVKEKGFIRLTQPACGASTHRATRSLQPKRSPPGRPARPSTRRARR